MDVRTLLHLVIGTDAVGALSTSSGKSAITILDALAFRAEPLEWQCNPRNEKDHTASGRSHGAVRIVESILRYLPDRAEDWAATRSRSLRISATRASLTARARSAS